MRTHEIIKEIQRLPVQEQIYVVEKTIHSIRKQEDTKLLRKAAEVLCMDYNSDKELTGFTNIDYEDFY